MNTLTIIVSIIVFMFFTSGFGKLKGIGGTAIGFQKKMESFGLDYLNMDMYKLIILSAAVWQIIASVGIVYASIDDRYRVIGMWSALSLVIFTILATLVYHSPPYGSQYYPFISNLTTCGGLLLIAYTYSSS